MKKSRMLVKQLVDFNTILGDLENIETKIYFSLLFLKCMNIS